MNLLNETLLNASQAAGEFKTNPSRATIARWMLEGANGIVLESIIVGARRYTSKEAIQRFLARINKLETVAP